MNLFFIKKIRLLTFLKLWKALQNQGFFQDQSLSDFGTIASRMLSGCEDFEVAKMQMWGKRTVLHSLLKLVIQIKSKRINLKQNYNQNKLIQ